MFNTFENCKTTLLETPLGTSFDGGIETEKLKSEAEKLIEKHISTSVSKAKSEAIAFLLRNSGIEINHEDVFVTAFDHADIMHRFLWSKLDNRECALIAKKVQAYEKENAFRAGRDFGHIAPDWQYLLNKGISGVISDLEALKNTCDTPEKVCYYDERIHVYKAVKDFFVRVSQLAKSRNTAKSDFIAENFANLAENPPRTLAEAMQFILIFYSLQMNLDTVIIRSLGGLDRMLYPFYKSDLESTLYTKEQLSEITKYFLWKISCLKTIANMPFYICGMDTDGNDATNEFTTFLLENYRELDIYDPKIHVMYHPNMDKGVLKLILEMIREGKNSFVFMNTPLASKALEKIGVSAEDAKKVIVYGCYETAAEGTEVPCTCAGMINLAKAIEITLRENKSFDSFDDFYEDVVGQLLNYTTLCMDTIAGYEAHYKDICPSLIMSPTYQNSRVTAIDLYEGGAKYNNTSIVGAGLATLVDSLVAVKHAVFEEKLISLDTFRETLKNNWEDNEKLRLIIKKKYPKFGNNISESDELAVDITNRFVDLINGRPNGRKGVFRCGLFSVDWRMWMGKETKATPDGRFDGEPISKNLCASIGNDKNGVTAYLKSVLKLDGERCPDGYVADVALHRSAVKGDDGMNAFTSLLSTFMEQGGFAVHFNILSPEALLKAQAEPEKYKNLQIRLCGWNVRFVDLDKKLQDEFILQAGNVM